MTAVELLGLQRGTPPSDDPRILIDLVECLRPPHASQPDSAISNLQVLALHLRHTPEDARWLRNYLLGLLASRRHLHLYTETGILSHRGYFTTLWNRFTHRLLPDVRRADYLRDLLGEVFHHSDDHVWLANIPDAIWGELIEALGFAEADHPAHAQIADELLEAARVLSHRLAALGLDPELVRVDPSLEEFESPFMAQAGELHRVLVAYRTSSADARQLDDEHVRVLLDQCRAVLERIRKLSSAQGASISLTYQLQRGLQISERLETVLALLNPAESAMHRTLSLSLFRELVREDNRRYSLVDVTRQVTDLLALQVTENASKTGEHYAAESRKEYFSIMRSAAGAGVIVGFMALVKIFAAKLALAPFFQALAYSMNYSLGFILVHVLHFTIATKQPAMTAATIAATVEQSTEKKRASLDNLVELIAVVMRTQIVSILGNVLLAIPVSFAIALALLHFTGAPPAGSEKAKHLLDDINPFTSLALFHAAIAGVCLFVAGLISGYYDNKASYNRIPERIYQMRWLRMLLGERFHRGFADYLGNNLGGLAGNFFFGIMLGCMGTIGFILGLPIDIRHVTFSAANLAYGIVGLDFQVSIGTVIVSVLGVALVGLTNLAVSFSLALYVALKSRKVRFDRSGELLALLWKRFLTRPRDFFMPPRNVEPTPPALNG